MTFQEACEKTAFTPRNLNFSVVIAKYGLFFSSSTDIDATDRTTAGSLKGRVVEAHARRVSTSDAGDRLAPIQRMFLVVFVATTLFYLKINLLLCVRLIIFMQDGNFNTNSLILFLCPTTKLIHFTCTKQNVSTPAYWEGRAVSPTSTTTKNNQLARTGTSCQNTMPKLHSGL